MKRRKPLKRGQPLPGTKGLKRTPLAQGNSRLKRTRLKPISDRRRHATQRAKAMLLDSRGRTMDQAPAFIHFDPRTKQLIWPPGGDVRSPEALAYFAELFVNPKPGEPLPYCWACERRRELDVAHIVPRSDELCNLLALCGNIYGDDSCHVWQEKNWRELRAILTIKQANDPHHTDYVRILELRRNLEIK